jgi:hypothetical protein
MERPVPELLLGFDASEADEKKVLSLADRVVEERGFANPGLASYHQGPTCPAPHIGEHLIEGVALSGTTYQAHTSGH